VGLRFTDAIRLNVLFGATFLHSRAKFCKSVLHEVTETTCQLTGKFGTWIAAYLRRGN